MGWSEEVRNLVMVKSARYCNVCHQWKGRNVEIHHIIPQEQGGENTFENAVLLCFDCHAHAGHYNPRHPKGSKFSPQELKLHRDNWYRIVETHSIHDAVDSTVILEVTNGDFSGVFKPKFIKRITTYSDRQSRIDIMKRLGVDPMEEVNKAKENHRPGPFYIPYLRNIQSYDDYCDFMNGDYPNSPFAKDYPDENEDSTCQPVVHHMESFGISPASKELYLSNNVLKLRLKNVGREVIEDLRLVLTFSNVVAVDSVTKQKVWNDMSGYSYNVIFDENVGEFIPHRNVLVQGESVKLDDICFRTHSSERNVILHWELFARNFKQGGFLFFQIAPNFKAEENVKSVYNPEDFQTSTRICAQTIFE